MPGNARWLPAADFRLYAVATRHPERLLRDLPPGSLQPTAWPGVQDLRWGGRTVRLIVLSAIAEHPRNAPWELFSARVDRIRHGLRHYRPRDPRGRELLEQLYFNYRLEIPDMAYTMEDFIRDAHRVIIEHIDEFDQEERQEMLARMTVEDRLRGLNPEDRLRGLDPEDRLRGLDPELIHEWLQRSKH